MKKRIILIILLLLALALTAYGCVQGQPDSVLAKAIGVCLECVGIG
jgi:hypothetical protein